MQGNIPAWSKGSSVSCGSDEYQEVCWKAVSLQQSREECIGVDQTRKDGRMAGAETQWPE